MGEWLSRRQETIQRWLGWFMWLRSRRRRASPLLRSPNRFRRPPLGSEVRADAEGFLTVTAKGIAEDFAQDLPDKEKHLLTATQGPTAAAVLGATITTAAWKTKPSWSVIASNDRAVPPELEKTEAAAMKATSITVPSSHVPMLSHPKEVADLIEQATSKVGSR